MSNLFINNRTYYNIMYIYCYLLFQLKNIDL